MGNKCEYHFCDEKTPSITNNNWMNYLNENISLKDLTIPGTHNSTAIYGFTFHKIKINKIPFAITQSWNLENQLKGGIRFFDLRLRVINNTLRAQHGPINQIITFDKIIEIFYEFLLSNPSEFILMSIQKEYDDNNSTKTIDDLYNEYILKYKNTIINFNESLCKEIVKNLRGKIIFLNAFHQRLDYQMGYYIQNEWVVNFKSEIKKKNKNIKTLFNRAITYNNDNQLYINYLSGSSDYLMVTPSTIAYNTNKEVFKYKGRLGIVLCDFPGEGLIYHLICQNFYNDQIFLKQFNNELNDYIYKNIKYQKVTCEKSEKIFFGISVCFLHVNTFKYLGLDSKNKLICMKDEFDWVIELKEKKNKESENINYVEDGDCILITNGNYNLECIISKNYYENPDEEKKDIILNCDNIFIEDLQITKNSYLLCDYSNKIEKTKYYEITRGSGRYNETEFIIKIY